MISRIEVEPLLIKHRALAKFGGTLWDRNLKMEFTVFYAWQSDSDAGVNRSFIETALKEALKRIDNDISIQASPRLDKDTAEVPGIPNIAETILEKILECGIFAADLTFVGSTADSGKLLSNANVLLELGIALGTVGWQRIILVMNTAFGEPHYLPFDLQHRRWPITYAIKDRQNASKGEIRRQLSMDLENAIRTIVQKGALKSMRQSERERITEERDQIHAKIKAGEFAELNVEQGQVVLGIFPVGLQPGSDEILRDEKLLSDFQPIWTSVWDWEHSGRAFRTYSNREKREAVTEIRRDGTIIAANNRLQMAGQRAFGNDPNVKVVPLWHIEEVLVDRATLYLNLLKRAGVEGAFFLSLALLNLEPTAAEMRPSSYGSGSSRVFKGGDIVPPDLVYVDRAAKKYETTSVASLLKPAFDFIWREFNFKCSPHYTKEGSWIE